MTASPSHRTVIGKGHSGALVAIVERQTKSTVSTRINDKSAETVAAATIGLLMPLKGSVFTITADNGKEFAYHEKMSEALDVKVYFADPYSSSAIASCITLSPASMQSWQSGLNENTNGLLRQYWPKITDFKKIPKKEVLSVIVQLNNRPRKTLSYQKPSTLMANHMAVLAA